MGRGSPPLDCRAGLSSVESGKLGYTSQGSELFGKNARRRQSSWRKNYRITL
jgi:hypothetical protein